MHGTRLHAFLQRTRRRLLVIGGMASICWAIALSILVLLTCVWLDLIWDLTAHWRLASAIIAIAAGLILFVTMILRAWSSAQPAQAARRLDRAAGGYGVILSGWELSGPSHMEHAGSTAELTAGLARMAVEQAACAAAAVPTAKAVSARPMQRAAGVSGLLFAACGLLALLLPNLAGTEMQRFLSPFSDVPRYSSVRFSVEPGDTSVVYGAGLDVRVTVVAGTVEQLELVIEDGEQRSEVVPMFPEQGQQWRTSLTRLTQPSKYSVRGEGARSPKYQIEVLTVPRIESVRFRITPPAYTNDAPFEGPLPKEGLAGLPGTRVSVVAKSNRPLQSGTITLQHAQDTQPVTLQPTTAGSDEVAGEFTLQAAGKFQLNVTDVAGQSSQDSLGGNIILLEDQRPFVRMLNPPQQSLATPSAIVPVAVAAEDDYGIARVALYRSLNNSRPLPLEWPVGTPHPRRSHPQASLTFADFGLSAGDEIKLFARVEDNYPEGGRGSECPVVTVRIISQADFERMLQEQDGLNALLSRYQAAMRHLENLQQRIEELEKKLAESPDGPVADAMREELKKLTEEAASSAEQVQESSEHPLSYDIDKNLVSEMQKLAAAMRDAAKSGEAMQAQEGLTKEQLAEKLAEMKQQLGQSRRQFEEQAMQPLAHLAQIFPLMQDEARFLELAQRQRDLSERMAEFKGHDGEDNPALKARMRDLEEEQRNLLAELKDLTRSITEHAAQLPDDPQLQKLRDTANAFAEALQDSGADEAMTNASSALGELAGTRGYEEATRAADILEGLISKCKGMGGQCQGCLAFNPSLSQCMGNTPSQLLAGMGFGNGNASGGGSGSGSGYSVRRGNGRMGLFGGLPGMASMQGFGAGQKANGEGRAGAWGQAGDADRPMIFPVDADQRAAGASEGSVPASYRQRVGQYFLRIAEEVGDEQ